MCKNHNCCKNKDHRRNNFFFYVAVPSDRNEQFQTMGLWAPDLGYKEIVPMVFWLLLSTSRQLNSKVSHMERTRLKSYF